MPRKIKQVRKRKLYKWAKRSKQRGGFIFSLSAIGAAIASAVAAAAPSVATGAVSAAAAYGTSKLLNKIGGRRRIKRR